MNVWIQSLVSQECIVFRHKEFHWELKQNVLNNFIFFLSFINICTVYEKARTFLSHIFYEVVKIPDLGLIWNKLSDLTASRFNDEFAFTLFFTLSSLLSTFVLGAEQRDFHSRCAFWSIWFLQVLDSPPVLFIRHESEQICTFSLFTGASWKTPQAVFRGVIVMFLFHFKKRPSF